MLVANGRRPFAYPPSVPCGTAARITVACTNVDKIIMCSLHYSVVFAVWDYGDVPSRSSTKHRTPVIDPAL